MDGDPDGHARHVDGSTVLRDGRILSWSFDKTFRVWDPKSGRSVATLTGHTVRPSGGFMLPDGHLLTWAWDATLRLWDGHTGAPLAGRLAVPDSVFVPDSVVLIDSETNTGPAGGYHLGIERALEMGATIEDITGIIHAHPTLSEGFFEAALRTLGHGIHV